MTENLKKIFGSIQEEKFQTGFRNHLYSKQLFLKFLYGMFSFLFPFVLTFRSPNSVSFENHAISTVQSTPYFPRKIKIRFSIRFILSEIIIKNKDHLIYLSFSIKLKKGFLGSLGNFNVKIYSTFSLLSEKLTVLCRTSFKDTVTKPILSTPSS